MVQLSGFLSPYRVVDLTDERGLLAGWMFGRLGAEVLQVEPPGGSPARHVGPFDESAPAGSQSLFWSAYASGKRSITCALDEPAGRDLLLRLIAQADVLLESAAPGVMQALGLGFDVLHAANPRLVYVSMTPFGSKGPKASFAETELIVWAAAGPLSPNRDHDGRPLRLSVPQEYLHGAADAAAGALLALIARHRTGRGQHVDVSAQQGSALCTLSTTLAAAVGHGNFQLRAEPRGKKKSLDLSGSGARTRRSKWPVKDGLLELHMGIGPAAGGSANKIFAWMREQGALPEKYYGWDWIKVPAQIQNDELGDEDLNEAREMVGRYVAQFTKAELLAVALERSILMAPACTIEDLAVSEHFASRGFYTQVSEGGRTRTLPANFAAGCDGAFVPLTGAPALGEHNAEIYGRLGLHATELADLRANGVV
jgi:crotonobetainyl-CoA:carnitine CoA-transferase CaiB-like acyl-CoA transferase